MPAITIKASALKIYPPLSACIQFSATTFGMIVLILAVLGSIVDVVKGQPPLAWLLPDLALVSTGVFGIMLVPGLLLFLLFRLFASSISADALRGPSFWGFRNTITWDNVGQVVATTVEGMPALVVSSATSNKEIYLYTLGADLKKIHAALWQHAGPQHVLTRLFRPQ